MGARAPRSARIQHPGLVLVVEHHVVAMAVDDGAGLWKTRSQQPMTIASGGLMAVDQDETAPR